MQSLLAVSLKGIKSSTSYVLRCPNVQGLRSLAAAKEEHTAPPGFVPPGGDYKTIVQKDGKIKVEFNQNPFKLHKLTENPSLSSYTTKQELLQYYKDMTLIRRVETAADNLYKQKLIRGFLHLYNGQEAIAIGSEAAITKKDHIITAYRDHGQFLSRGGTAKEIFCELLGKRSGCSHGKGGSMHMYKNDANFHGGNGIVGAQVPIGAGIALAQQYLGNGQVCLTYYGDGAANQGQVFEAYNMAALWKLPCIFICENNKYGMGTSAERSSAEVQYYKRGDYIPGLKIDAVHVLAVREGMKYAVDYAKKKGPIVVEMETYRYMGHSMSDPGITYRTREEINLYRTYRDPIVKIKTILIDNKLSTEEETEAIDKEIRKEVDEAIEFAKNDPFPDPKELYTDIYTKSSGPYYVRTVELSNSTVINP